MADEQLKQMMINICKELIEGFDMQPEDLFDMGEWIREHASDYDFYKPERM